MSTALAVIQHQQVTRPGSTIGTNMLVIRLIAVVQQIVITGATLLALMYKRLSVLTRNGISCHFVPVVTIVQEHLKWTKNLFLFLVIFKFSTL